MAGMGIGLAVSMGAVAGPLELNPSAPNTGAAGGTALDPTTPSFFTTNSNTGFTAFLSVGSTPGSVGTTTATETGSILVLTYNLLPGSIAASSNVTQTWNEYATFSFSGTGSWGTGAASGIFTVTSPVAASVTLWGSPGSNATSGLSFVTPIGNSGTSEQVFGVHPGSSDFVLGTPVLMGVALPA